MRYIFWLVGFYGLQEAHDVTKHGCHISRHLGFYQELETRLKRRELVLHRLVLWFILSPGFAFVVKRS